MESKKILEALAKIATNQQKILHKLAQALPPDSLPTSKVEVTDGHQAGQVSEPPANDLSAKLQHQDPTKAIVSALGDFYTKTLNGLSVDASKNQVNVSFRAGQATQANYNHVTKTIQNLQNSNVLMGGPYKVVVD